MRRWRKLAEELMGWANFEGSAGRKKLDAIERQHTSIDARLKALMEVFLLGEGRYRLSWRRLIHALHKAGETHTAEKIKTNAEPQQGEWVSHDESLSSVHVCRGRGGGMYAPLTC